MSNSNKRFADSDDDDFEDETPKPKLSKVSKALEEVINSLLSLKTNHL